MKNLIYCLTITFFLSLPDLNAQSYDAAFKAGVKSFNKRDYSGAITKFKEALKYNNRSEIAWYYTGMAFKSLERFEAAALSFQKIEGINPDYNPWFYLEAGNAYIKVNKFPQAQRIIEKFLVKYPKESKNTLNEHVGKNRLNYAIKSPELRAQPNTMSEPVPVANLNSISNDYTPQVNPLGTRLYFTSVRRGGFDFMADSSKVNDFGEDVYVSNLIDDKWSTPGVLPAPINSSKADFGSAFTSDGQTMVYVRCSDKESVGSCDLYITNLDGTVWSEPVNMGNVVNSEEWESQPTINSDGTRIIFSSTRAGGYGGSDLYMVEKNHLGDWGIPQNLGSIVNTPLNETSPYIASDNKTLYYASDGHPGFGGSDVFYTLFDNGKWSIPINLGAPLNSPGEDKDFSISAHGMGYFASSRLDENNYDIFQIELPEYLRPKPSVVVQGIVSNSETSAPLDALVLVEDLETGELIAINKSNSTTGDYLVVLPVGRNYSVSATRDGYFFYSQSFELPKDTTYQEIKKDILLEPIKKGTKVVLNNIFFETGKAELKPISYVELNKAVKLLEDNATMVVEIGGHTDSRGSDAANLSLSQARAKSVQSYLELAGIESSRLRSKGYGETVPIADNETAEGRTANRRTEFVIVEF